MKCKDCVYYWQAEDEDFPQCNFDGDSTAPCEYNDLEDE